MPKTFTGKEKEIIRKTLIRNGKELFSKYGLKKTSITELTNTAGIAQGTFYKFFESKEELYFEILELEESESAEYLENIVKSSKSAKESIKKIIKCTFNLFEETSFYGEFLKAKIIILCYVNYPKKNLKTIKKMIHYAF